MPVGWPAVNPAVDHEFLGLQVDGRARGHSAFELVPHLCRFDGQLYGGTALAVALAAFEAATDRPAVWATVQFVSQARLGDRVGVHTEVLAHGRRIDQVQLRATVDDRVVFTAMGSTGERRDGMHGTGPVMPRVQPLEQARRWGAGRVQHAEMGWHLRTDLGEVALLDSPDDARGRMAIWARITDQTVTTAAKLGFLADMVPVAVARACGASGAGISLDNSLRVGRLVDSEWVLLELVAHTAHAGFGHGEVLIWAPDGTLLGTGAQTAKMFEVEGLEP